MCGTKGVRNCEDAHMTAALPLWATREANRVSARTENFGAAKRTLKIMFLPELVRWHEVRQGRRGRG